jgi:hypothetical protein
LKGRKKGQNSRTEVIRVTSRLRHELEEEKTYSRLPEYFTDCDTIHYIIREIIKLRLENIQLKKEQSQLQEKEMISLT